MPYAYRKIRGKNAYKVFNKVSGVIHSNSTSLENAKKQIQLLNAIEKNPNFKPKKGGMMEDDEDDELVEIDENRIRRKERQLVINNTTQSQIETLKALKLIPNPTLENIIAIGVLERQIRKAITDRGGEEYNISPAPIIERSVPIPIPPSTPTQDDKRRRLGKGTAGSKEVAPITEDAKKRGEEIKKRIAEIEESNTKKVDTLKKAELKRIKAELKKIEKEDPDYVAVDINIGKGLPVGDIQKLLKNSYQIPPAETVGNFVLDKSLSGRRVQVYKNRKTPQAVVVHRGTQGMKDWATDLFYATGGDTAQTNRFKHALQVQKKAESKYGANNITTLGHSLGGKISSTVGQNSKEIINLNKAVSPLDAVKTTSDKEINIRTSGDPVSALLPIRQQNKRTITIPSKTYNPFTEHKTDTLGRLPPNRIIGAGLTPQEIRGMIVASPVVALVIAELSRRIRNLIRVAPEPEDEEEEDPEEEDSQEEEEETKDATDIEMGEGLDSPEDEGREATLTRRDREQASLHREQAESIPTYADELMSGIRNPDVFVRNYMINLVRNQGLNRMDNRINQIRNGINNNPRIYDTEQVREALRDIETARAIVFYQHNPPDNPETRGQGVGLAKKISPPIKKMKGKTNPWVDYVRSFAKDKGMNYGLALKHPDLSKGYKKGGMIDGSSSTPSSKIPSKITSKRRGKTPSYPLDPSHPSPFTKIRPLTTRPLTEEEKSDIYMYVDFLTEQNVNEARRDELLGLFNSQLDEEIVVVGVDEEEQIQRIKDGYAESINIIADDITEGKGISRLTKPFSKRGRGMPTSKEAVIAETYNESQLGAQGGKKYVSL